MKVIKRDGREVQFDKQKINQAILKAMKSGSGIIKPKIAESISEKISQINADKMTIAEIEEIIYSELIIHKQKLTAKSYEAYRAVREFQRKSNTIDNKIIGLINGDNKESLTSNSNKQSALISTQRDLVAEEVSKDIALRMMLPPHIAQAHNDGLIYIHDLGHYLNPSANCCLVNLKDMLENGTVINGKMITKPNSFQTACTVATQIIAQVASGQFGGQTISIAHLSPFVRISEQKIREEIKEDLSNIISTTSNEYENIINSMVKKRLKKEIKAGIQTFQYQINTLQTSNGQAPFLSVFMYISEYPEYEKETVMLIEEILKQRIKGMQNEVGAWITPAFPKLLYVTDENNIYEDSKYFYLTKLASECVARRMMPDLISAKKMKENYEGNVFGCMGCVDGNEVITYKIDDKLYVESFQRMWSRVSENNLIQEQLSKGSYFIDTDNVKIYDSKNGFVKVKRIIKNKDNSDWYRLKFSNGRTLLATSNHPLPVLDKGRTYVKDLSIGDKINITNEQYVNSLIDYPEDKAWLLGVLCCDSSYDRQIVTSLAGNGEDDIIEKYQKELKKYFNVDSYIKLQQRGEKGTYNDIVAIGDFKNICNELINIFGGTKKNDRQIPNEAFSWKKESRLAFLAGMLDADGYINPTSHGGSIVQLGSVNKELSLQTLSLVNSLKYPSKVYLNKYNKNDSSKIRYRIEFPMTEELLKYVACKKKRDNFTKTQNFIIHEESSVSGIEFIGFQDKYSYDVTTESDYFDVSGIYSHNCRAWLSPYKNENGEYVWYGRLNMGLTSLNLADVGLSARGNIDNFWNILNDRLELCKESLMLRYEKLKNVTSDVSPIHWQNGAIARLGKHEPIYPLLQNGYSTISLGYIGLYECVMALIGESHTSKNGEKLALDIMHKIRNTVDKWKKQTGLGFALYGTPSESLTERFAKLTRQRWGEIKGITDRNYLTNSYHVFVKEEINAFDKLKFESQFHSISSGGCISYIEIPNMIKNIEAITTLIQYMYDNIQYAEFNTKLDYCMKCSYDGEIICNDDLQWTCPNCGNTDTSLMNICRRTCGYLGENLWNLGRTQEIKERVLHI